MSLLVKLGLGALAAVILAVAILWIAGWGPFAPPGKAIAKEQHKDAAASTKIEAKGAQAVTKDAAAAATVKEQANEQVRIVTRTVRLSPSASTPIPGDRLDRLRAADRELCKLGVDCAGGGEGPGGPAATPDAGVGAAGVPALRPAK